MLLLPAPLKSAPRFFALLVGLTLAGCSPKDDADSTPAPDGNAPILDAAQTGWERVGRVPLTSPAGINFANAMTVYDLQLSGPDLQVLYREERALQTANATSVLKALVPAGGVGTITPTNLNERVRGVGGTTDYSNFFFFRPGTYTAYQGLNSFPSGNQAIATSQVLTETGQVYCAMNGNGGTFSGAAPRMQADGSVLYGTSQTGGGINGNYWWHWLADFQAGRWTRAISQGLSAYTAHTTLAFQPVHLTNGRLYGAVVLDDGVAIADTLHGSTKGSDATLPIRAFTTFPGYKSGDKILARAVGNTLLFATWRTANDVTSFSAYRWTEGGSTVQQLYANVTLPAATSLQSEVQLDDSGAAFFFATATTPSGLPAIALTRVDPAGVKTVSTPVNLKGLYAFSCPRQFNGQWYAGLGPTLSLTSNAPRNLDLVRLKL